MEKSSMVEYNMKDGTKIQMTLNFYRLYQLKTKHPVEYTQYMELRKTGIITDLDATVLLYVAYLCANLEKMPDVMSYEEFLQKMPNGRDKLWDAVGDLNSDEKN